MFFKKIINFIIFALLISIITSCSTRRAPVVHFRPISFGQITGWEEDNHAEALNSFMNSCQKIMQQKANDKISSSTKLGGRVIDWQAPCMSISKELLGNRLKAKQFFEKWFIPYRVLNEEGEKYGKLTGYFQIELFGSKTKHGKYKYPIYRCPGDLNNKKGTHLISHSAINKGALRGRGLEIVYVDNLARLYLLHIQGSGIIRLKEGGTLNIGFAGHNGYKFKGISEALRKRNLKFSCTKDMWNYIHMNPQEGVKILEEDPSYVFFSPQQDDKAIGAQGVKLIPERSIAIDSYLYPYSTPIWISTQLNKHFEGRKYRRLFIAQDRGGAIRGAIRADVFFGKGKSAEDVATKFNVKGEFIVLFPKTVSIPLSYQSMSN